MKSLEDMVLPIETKLTRLDPRVFSFAKAASNDSSRTTRRPDILFDIMATEYAVNKKAH